MSATFFITTAIPYVNAQPHIGFALEAILTDSFARYWRQRRRDVRFLTGTDENSLKNVQAAEKEGVPTAELVASNSERFRALRGPLNLSFDDFLRTSSDARHLAGVARLWEACATNGDIYQKSYTGKYCVGCERYYAEDELENGLCPVHKTLPDVIEEQNYFFRLSNYQDALIKLIETDELTIVPVTRKNEVLSFIKQGLEDFSISRSQERAHGWGIPVPNDPSQVVYVWYDALGNYITALDYATNGELFQRYWTNGNERVHVIGKDIIRFHAVYWPAMLLSAKAALPSTIVVHGFLTINGEKISKSLGNVIDPVSFVENYGIDPLRYYLLHEIRASEDGDFSTERFVRSYNAELADQLGNLLNRVINMTQRYFDGKVPEPSESTDAETDLIAAAKRAPDLISAAMSKYSPREGIDAVWALINEANRYTDQMAPWSLAKNRADPAVDARLRTVLYSLAEAIRVVAVNLTPFLPNTATAVAERISVQNDVDPYAVLWGGIAPGTPVHGGPVLFPKLEAIIV